MAVNFLSLTPFKRYQKMQSLLELFRVNALNKQATFIILIYGSASYGFKKDTSGKFGDIDLLLIIPRNIDVGALIASTENTFFTKMQVSIPHLERMIASEWEMCRMYGEVDGVRLGFRLMCLDTFLAACAQKSSTKNIRNIATLGHSRILDDVEWSFRLWKYIPITLDHEYIISDGEQLLLVNHHTFSKGKQNLGAFGRKLLTGKVVYDPYMCAEAAILSVFKQTVLSSLGNKNVDSDEQILEALYRVERFSDSFRNEVLQKIVLAKALR